MPNTKKTTATGSFIARIKRVRSAASLQKLIDTIGAFPYSNPKTRRRRIRAINEKFAAFGIGATLS